MTRQTKWAIGCLLFVWTMGAIGLYFQIPTHIQTALQRKS